MQTEFKKPLTGIGTSSYDLGNPKMTVPKLYAQRFSQSLALICFGLCFSTERILASVASRQGLSNIGMIEDS